MDFSKFRSILFFVLLGLVTLGFLVLFRPFFYPLFWAAVIASIFYPLYKRLNKKIKHPRLNALIVILLVFFIIVIPVAVIGGLVVREANGLAKSIEENLPQITAKAQSTLSWLQNNSYLQKLGFDQNEWIQRFQELARMLSDFLVKNLGSFTQASVVFVGMFILMLYSLYFFLRDGARFLKLAMHLCPLGDRYEKILYEKFTNTALQTLKSSMLVGLIQGVLGTILFTLVGVPGAVVWGLLMTALCVLPIGSGFIWGPVGIILLATGNVWQGIVVLSVGIIIISTIDNLLRPLILGKETSMHPLLILFSTLGGIAFFGITGFLIGPIITALLVAFWEMYDDYYKQELDRNK